MDLRERQVLPELQHDHHHGGRLQEEQVGDLHVLQAEFHVWIRVLCKYWKNVAICSIIALFLISSFNCVLFPHVIMSLSPYVLISTCPHLLMSSSPYVLIFISPHLHMTSSHVCFARQVI